MSEIKNGEPVELVDETDEISEIIIREHITVKCSRIESRPDVSACEQALWQKHDPDYPPEHYHCVLKRGGSELELYQTVGADYPDEDESADNSDLYCDAREIMLSPEFLLESAALKAHSIDQSTDLEDWIAGAIYETTTPAQTYEHYKSVRDGLFRLLDPELYAKVVRLAVEAELENEDDDDEE